MKLNAWEDLGGGGGGWELVDQSMEARERHRGGTGVTVSRGWVSGCVSVGWVEYSGNDVPCDNAWEDLDSTRRGCELLDQSMESS